MEYSLNTYMKVTAAQRRMIDDAVSNLDIERPARGMIVHLLHTAEVHSLGEWTPIHHKVLINDLPSGWKLEERNGGTKRAWAYDNSPVEAYRSGYYYYGATRQYRIDPDWALEFKSRRDTGKPTYKAVKGTRSKAATTMGTNFYDDSGNVWGEERDDLPTGDSLLDGALRVLKDADHVLDATALPKAFKTYERELDEVLEQYWGDTSEHADNQRRKARARVYSLQSGIETIKQQTRYTDEDGVTHIKNAYKVQELSGRISFRRGGPQGLPKEVKSIVYDVEGLRNYSIPSSQATSLRQLESELQELGIDVDTFDTDDMMRELAEHLLSTYWDAHKTRGGRGKGWTMRNYCGITFCPYDYEKDRRRRSKAMAWYLQGLEAAYVHAVTVLSVEYDYEPIANEHDGLICKGEIPAEAMRRARELSGFRKAELAEKPFENIADMIAFCEKGDIGMPTHTRGINIFITQTRHKTMTNITYDEAKAEYDERIDFQSGKHAGVRLENNTRLVKRSDAYAVRLHRTDVVTLREDSDITLRTGGWKTHTTKQRINKYSPVGYIFQEDGRWYISTSDERLLWSEAVDIVSGPGIRLRPDGNLRERIEREPAMA